MPTAGFKALFPGGSSGTYMIYSVVESSLVDDIIKLTEEICGNLETAGAGFLFTVPVSRVKGFAKVIP